MWNSNSAGSEPSTSSGNGFAWALRKMDLCVYRAPSSPSSLFVVLLLWSSTCPNDIRDIFLPMGLCPCDDPPFTAHSSDPKLREETEDLQIRTVSGSSLLIGTLDFLTFWFKFFLRVWSDFSLFVYLFNIALSFFLNLKRLFSSGAVISVLAGFFIMLLTTAQISAYFTGDVVQVRFQISTWMFNW